MKREDYYYHFLPLEGRIKVGVKYLQPEAFIDISMGNFPKKEGLLIESWGTFFFCTPALMLGEK
ncbi:MAG: hypothetical protein DRH33_07630 [Candidatus Nealsonbacteria bacterium]|nr:MAG: hypothetical protein DRH33_07630 [Candidatus Nealsonbacteria bacterium]